MDFEDIVEKMPTYMERLEGCEPIRMFTKGERDLLRRRIPDNVGIYVLYENGEPVYVGRSDKLADRLLSHGRPSSGSESATFAFNLARSECPLYAAMSRQDLLRDAVFRRGFDSAKERVRRMEVRVVSLADPIEQTIFEVYAHLQLDTPFNSFENH